MKFHQIVLVVYILIVCYVMDSGLWDILDPMALRSPKGNGSSATVQLEFVIILEWRVPDPPINVRAKPSDNAVTLWYG